ncbi:hypothetical protein B0J11DRAFT_171978 [Dendryphion nanum]|uniref:Uncharacterized protein n=1 Tax=Dendryphion nanum TaxID=256645 RepID=A0A9P9IYP4_9PLEO|nr:hypothetical protein B0J11DRAFT_171978 [Dendryphion nanum]
MGILKFVSLVCLALINYVAASNLAKREACYQDNCLRAINGTRRGPSHPITGTSHCIDYMTTTVFLDAILTTTTVTFGSNITDIFPCTSSPSTTQPTLPPRLALVKVNTDVQGPTTSFSTTHGTVPFYATSACTNELYSSACSCLGISSTIVTRGNSIITKTISTTIMSRITGRCTTASSSTAFNITFSHNGTTSTTSVILTSNPHGTGTGTGTSTSTSIISPTSGSTSRATTLNSTTSHSEIASHSTSTNFTTTSRTTLIPPFTNTTTAYISSSTFSVNTTTTTSFNGSTSTTPTDVFTSTSSSNATTSEPPIDVTTTMISINTTTTTPPTDITTSTSLNITTTIIPTNTTTSIRPTPTCRGHNVQPCNGNCTSLGTDSQNCGQCGNRCPSGTKCTNGVCTRPPCNSTCGNSFSCGSFNSTCACFTETSGRGVCILDPTDCSNDHYFRCGNNWDCDLGFVCVPNTCCSGNICVNTQGCEGSARLGLSGPIRRVGRLV